jgi:hypothetical protein
VEQWKKSFFFALNSAKPKKAAQTNVEIEVEVDCCARKDHIGMYGV